MNRTNAPYQRVLRDDLRLAQLRVRNHSIASYLWAYERARARYRGGIRRSITHGQPILPNGGDGSSFKAGQRMYQNAWSI